MAFFVESVQLIQDELLTNAYIIFGLEPLHNIHLRISNLLKEFTFIYLKSDAISSQLEKAVH